MFNFIFNRLEEHTKLEWPYRQKRAVAMRDFEPQDPDHIAFRQGQEVIVIGQEGYREGWWRGKCDNQVSDLILVCFSVFICFFLGWLLSSCLCENY